MVYGLGFSSAMSPVWAGFSAEQKPGFPPRELLDLYKFLMCFEVQDSPKRISRYAGLMIRPCGYAPGEPVFWPGYWIEKDARFDESFERMIPLSGNFRLLQPGEPARVRRARV